MQQEFWLKSDWKMAVCCFGGWDCKRKIIKRNLNSINFTYDSACDMMVSVRDTETYENHCE